MFQLSRNRRSQSLQLRCYCDGGAGAQGSVLSSRQQIVVCESVREVMEFVSELTPRPLKILVLCSEATQKDDET